MHATGSNAVDIVGNGEEEHLNPMTQYFCVGYSILLGRMHLLQFARMNESE